MADEAGIFGHNQKFWSTHLSLDILCYVLCIFKVSCLAFWVNPLLDFWSHLLDTVLLHCLGCYLQIAMHQLDEILEITAFSNGARVLRVPAHTNFNSLLLHFVALKEVSSAMRFMENINADAVTISADLIWARSVHQLAARSVSLAGFAHHRVSLLVSLPLST